MAWFINEDILTYEYKIELGWTVDRMNEWMNERTNEWMNERINWTKSAKSLGSKCCQHHIVHMLKLCIDGSQLTKNEKVYILYTIYHKIYRAEVVIGIS